MANRSKAFVSNTVATALYQVTLIVSGLVIPRFVIAHYGSESNGLVTSLMQFVSTFTLVEAGISAAAVFALYQPLADKEWLSVSKVVSAARRFYNSAGFIFVGLVLVLALVYPLYVTGLELNWWQVGILVFALGASGFLDFFTLSKYRALLTADKKTWIIQLASTLYLVLNTLVIALLSVLGVHLVVVFVVAVLPTFVRAGILMLYCRRAYPEVAFHAPSEDVSLHQRWDALFLQVQAALQQGAPVMIATLVLRDLTAVSVFSIYMLVYMGCQRLANIVGTGLQAVFGEVMIKGQKEVLQRSYREYEIIVHGLTAVICGVAFAQIIPFIDLYTAGITADNYTYPLLGALVTANIYFYQIKTPQGLMVIAAGHFKETRWRTAIQSAILIIGSVVLGAFFGFYGVICGVIISNIYRSVDLYIYVSRRITHLPIRESFGRSVVTAGQSAVTAIPLLLVGDRVSTSLTTWVLISLLGVAWGAVTVFASNLLIYKRDTLSLVSRARKLVLKK